MKPKVRARDTSLTKEVVEKSISALQVRWLKAGWSNSMEKPTLKPSKGSKRAHLSPSRTTISLLDADEALVRVLLFDPCRLQQEHERDRRCRP
jgi:hypothetical protein